MTENGGAASSTDAPPPAIAGPAPPRYHDPQSWRLISQGAEARVWLVQNFVSVGFYCSGSSSPGRPTTSPSTTTAAVCKERFPKSYRHPVLDRTITRGRTKSEAKCLDRCRKGGVPCPDVLGVDIERAKEEERRSCCLFLEHVTGCTVRDYLEARSDHDAVEDGVGEVERDGEEEEEGGEDEDEDAGMEDVGVVKTENEAGDAVEGEEEGEGECKDSGGLSFGGGKGEEPDRKRARRSASGSFSGGGDETSTHVKMTLVDTEALSVSRSLGRMIADMHFAGIVHGDLTTSNVMLRNPPPLKPASDDAKSTEVGENDGKAAGKEEEHLEPPCLKAVSLQDGEVGYDESWNPDICLIDFGLSGTAGSKGTAVEEKAVDLYVLERAFEATHPGSHRLVEEILRSYEKRSKERESQDKGGSVGKSGGKKKQKGGNQSVTAGVMGRLKAVRLRGRKRECFG